MFCEQNAHKKLSSRSASRSAGETEGKKRGERVFGERWISCPSDPPTIPSRMSPCTSAGLNLQTQVCKSLNLSLSLSLSLSHVFCNGFDGGLGRFSWIVVSFTPQL